MNLSTHRALSLAAVVLASPMCLVDPGQAEAGTYVATNCSSLIQGAPDAVSSTNTSVYPRSVDCEQQNIDTGLRVLNAGGIGPSHAYGVWSWYAPPGTVFSDLFFKFNVASDAGHIASVTVPGAGTWKAPPFDSGWNSIDTVPIVATSLNAWLECAGPCAPSNAAHAYVKDLYFTISDNTSPSITSLSGALLADGVRRGTQEVTVAGIDNASLTGVSVRANGVLVAERQLDCNLLPGPGPAASFYPCPTSAAWTIPINTELLPDGHNSLQVCIEDLSFDPGGKNAACESRTIAVDNSCPSSGGVAATALNAGLQAGNSPVRPSLRIGSNQPASVRGTLNGPGNLGGSTVCLYEQVDLPGDGRELVDTARVRNDGSFALAVDPGPSRNFDVVYRYNDQTVEQEQLHLDSRVAPGFKVVGRTRLLNGQNVRFRGRIPGPNADGRGISLQARAGKKWRTFKQVKADSSGLFRGLYRFTQTIGRAQYIFRARVKRQGNYPYSPGSSKPRSVVVRGGSG